MIREQQTDILIVGGGVGGCAAALAAARLGRRVILTEESDWLGGQLTTQAVPPDEHQWMDRFGGTQSYRRLREEARDYYRRYYPLTPDARFDPALKLGASLVTRPGAEPRVWLAALEALLAPFRSAGRITVWLKHKPVAVHRDGDRVRAVTLLDLETGDQRTFAAPYVLDATELGDLLALGEVEYVTGRESRAQTGEPHALDGEPQPLSMQAITHVFAIDHLPGEDHTIERPALYDEFKHSFGYATEGSAAGKHLFPEPSTALFSDWMFRRVLYAGHFKPGFMPSDVTLFNAMNDYPDGPIVELPEAEIKEHLYRARQRSLSVLYWLQTEAPHWRGAGRGYPGLRLRPDVVGTSDGLAKAPYIRESRRIKAEQTILEQHVSAEVRDEAGLAGAERFPDSVGIGRYSIDIHLSTPARPGGRPEPSRVRVTSRPAGESRPRAWPFQIPLGALLPVRVENLLPSSKNLGVTHITNGCYRLHPIEWNIGEAAGALAAFCLEHGTAPRQVRADGTRLADYQYLLEQLGVELAWPDLSAAGSYNQWANKRRRHSWGELPDELPFWATSPVEDRP